jgi:hypothetical protein
VCSQFENNLKATLLNGSQSLKAPTAEKRLGRMHPSSWLDLDRPWLLIVRAAHLSF